MEWTYNWENEDIAGAPLCSWKIDKDGLYLTEISLPKNIHPINDKLEFKLKKRKQFSVNLSKYFINEIEGNIVFANWVNGIYAIKHIRKATRKDKEKHGFVFYMTTKYIYVRIVEGIVINKHELPCDIDGYIIQSKITPEIKKMDIKNKLT